MRGTPCRRPAPRTGPGIIPACAGNTNYDAYALRKAWDHPRVCGEHSNRQRSGVLRWGSSPRVRGTPKEWDRQKRAERIIPACAGNTCGSTPTLGASWDHPRVCGEHEKDFARGVYWRGSSPRVRGTRRAGRPARRLPGIIPACAGNTTSPSNCRTSNWDHPRVCGEHAGFVVPFDADRGSSPRVRGTQQPARVLKCGIGIIPACAGNTTSTAGRLLRTRDHPRVCGEHFKARSVLICAAGSSPRVRGTPAGFMSKGTYLRDHPRVCGEHFTAPMEARTLPGSSPRVRGTR